MYLLIDILCSVQIAINPKSRFSLSEVRRQTYTYLAPRYISGKIYARMRLISRRVSGMSLDNNGNTLANYRMMTVAVSCTRYLKYVMYHVLLGKFTLAHTRIVVVGRGVKSRYIAAVIRV